MTRPWTLPGVIEKLAKDLNITPEQAAGVVGNCQNELPIEETKVSERKTAAVDDFATIKEALERIQKEEKEAQERAAKESEPVPEMDYSCNGVEVNLANSCADIYPDCEISEAYKEHQEYIKQAEAAGTYITDKVIEDALKILARRELGEAYKKDKRKVRGCSCEMCYGRHRDLT